MWAAVPGPVRPVNVNCHWSAAPVPDWVAVAANVPRAPDVSPAGAGTSEGAFMVAIRPIVVAWPRASAAAATASRPSATAPAATTIGSPRGCRSRLVIVLPRDRCADLQGYEPGHGSDRRRQREPVGHARSGEAVAAREAGRLQGCAPPKAGIPAGGIPLQRNPAPAERNAYCGCGTIRM